MSQPQQLDDLLEGAAISNIVCHNNPDLDCLASALALGRIAAAAGIDEQQILYSGEISYQQKPSVRQSHELHCDLSHPTAATSCSLEAGQLVTGEPAFSDVASVVDPNDKRVLQSIRL